MKTCPLCDHEHDIVPVEKRINEDSWLNEERFASFLKCYRRACGSTLPAMALAKVSAEDAYWIWHSIQGQHDRAYLYE